MWQETEFAVKDTQVHGGYVLHVGVVEGTLSVGDKLSLLVDGVSGAGLVDGVSGAGLVGWVGGVGWWAGLVDGVSGAGLVDGVSGAGWGLGW